jgi:hypothetical protein
MTLAEELMKRMRQAKLPPRERLEKLLNCDTEKGTFHWKVDVGRRQAGDPAGAVLPDRHCITIDGKNYRAKRIAWYLVHGEVLKTRLYAKNAEMTDHRATNITDDTLQAWKGVETTQLHQHYHHKFLIMLIFMVLYLGMSICIHQHSSAFRKIR